MSCIQLVPCHAQEKSSGTASKILETASVSRGVCILIGSGSERNPGLIAELASGDMHVHGIATDDASLSRARAAIVQKDVPGLAIVERASLSPLPYVPDIANLVVVEDWDRLSAQGLTMAEVERVTAPGGSICVFKDGNWKRTVKARPSGMGDWPDTRGGPAKNWVSTDTVVRLPLGLRWQDGVPNSLNQRSDCRGWVLAGGRCFVLHVNEIENIPPFPNARKNSNVEYLAAHDAFNGTLLWKVQCEPRTWFTEGLNANNGIPLVSDGKRVFVAKAGGIAGFDAATGKQLTTSPVLFPTVHLSLSEGVLVASGWESHVQKGWWDLWTPKTEKGAVEGFGAEDGAAKWSFKEPAVQMLIDSGTVLLLIQNATPATQQSLVALDLKKGTVRWRINYDQLSKKPDLHVAGIGAGIVTVNSAESKLLMALSLENGKKLWEMPVTDTKPLGVWSPIVDGKLWYGSSMYDLKTGSVAGSLPVKLGTVGCTPITISPGVIAKSRDCTYMQIENGKVKVTQKFSQRGQCIVGATIANGMLYSGQNLCHCATGQVLGFVGFGWNGEPPSAADFEKPRPVEKGPAASSAAAVKADAGNGWPTFMHDAGRSCSTSAKLPKNEKQLWTSAPLVADRTGVFPEAWRSRLAQCITAPVVSGSTVVVATIDRGEVVAMDLNTGKQIWRNVAGGRIDSSPTISGDLCVFGANDGWITALRLTDGAVAWRARAAPREQFMMAFGQMESLWPVHGSVLVIGGNVYATMGRSNNTDGGIGALALKLSDGSTVWAEDVPSDRAFQNDMLSFRNGKIQLYQLLFDPLKGSVEWTSRGSKHFGLNGMSDPSWTRLGPLFSGRSRYERVQGELLAWNDKELVVYNANKTGKHYFSVIPLDLAKTIEAKGRKAAVDNANPNAQDENAADSKKAAPKNQDPKKIDPVLVDELIGNDCRWSSPVPAFMQGEAMAICGDVLLLGGRTWDPKEKKLGGFLWKVSMQDGKKLSEMPLESPPVMQGLAVVDGRILLSLQNGKIICIGD